MYGTDCRYVRVSASFSVARCKQTDVRIGALHDLAVELEHEAQHAVRGRVLRTEVQRVVLDLSHDDRRSTRPLVDPAKAETRWRGHA